MLARYSHIRMEAKRKALEAIVEKPPPAAQPAQQLTEGTTRQTDSRTNALVEGCL
jgi:hypothetical protein